MAEISEFRKALQALTFPPTGTANGNARRETRELIKELTA